jgi:hypothetical protein
VSAAPRLSKQTKKRKLPIKTLRSVYHLDFNCGQLQTKHCILRTARFFNGAVLYDKYRKLRTAQCPRLAARRGCSGTMISQTHTRRRAGGQVMDSSRKRGLGTRKAGRVVPGKAASRAEQPIHPDRQGSHFLVFASILPEYSSTLVPQSPSVCRVQAQVSWSSPLNRPRITIIVQKSVLCV